MPPERQRTTMGEDRFVSRQFGFQPPRRHALACHCARLLCTCSQPWAAISYMPYSPQREKREGETNAQASPPPARQRQGKVEAAGGRGKGHGRACYRGMVGGPGRYVGRDWRFLRNQPPSLSFQPPSHPACHPPFHCKKMVGRRLSGI